MGHFSENPTQQTTHYRVKDIRLRFLSCLKRGRRVEIAALSCFYYSSTARLWFFSMQPRCVGFTLGESTINDRIVCCKWPYLFQITRFSLAHMDFFLEVRPREWIWIRWGKIQSKVLRQCCSVVTRPSELAGNDWTRDEPRGSSKRNHHLLCGRLKMQDHSMAGFGNI